ncbi:MAG: 30S ribosomal protein S17, partial [Candidatus Pacebacteria bacterium]|nr:30S ribosomal protein S17 [Candidatus Paceibacterota bacterium]
MKTTQTKTVITTRKKLSGKVVSDKMDKTVVVNVNRYLVHKKYGKYFKIDKRYK